MFLSPPAVMTIARSAYARPALLVALSLSLGCSFAFVRPPRPRPDNPRAVECSSNAAPPVLDLLLVGIGGVGMLNAAGGSDGDYAGSTLSRENTFILAGAIAAAAAFSAAHGFSTVNRGKALSPPAPAPADVP
jgi:hypothetical protein